MPWHCCRTRNRHQFLGSGDAWRETLAVIRAQGADAATFERIYVEALRRLAPVASEDRVRWYDLVRAIVSWALWRRPGPERQTLLAAAQATQTDVDRQKEIGLMGQTIAESIWEEGRLKGEADGELKALRHVLRRMLTEHFGAVSETVMVRIESCGDTDRLTAAIVQVPHIATPDELGL